MTATLSYGADPEFFLHTERGGIATACGLIGGTKDKPRMVDGFGLQEDNVMVEFTVPPQPSPDHLFMVVSKGVQVAVREARTKLPGARLYSSASAIFPHSLLAAAGAQAMQFGCSPDFDAYRMGQAHERVLPSVLDTTGGAWRFAGGHLHIGYKEHTDMPEPVAALLMDLTVGLRLITSGETQGARRGLYGMAGRYRPTGYGIEYRTPSNQWLYNGDVASGMIGGLNLFRHVLGLPGERLLALYNETPWPDVQRAINTEDYELACRIQNWLSTTYNVGRGEE